jgi:hypothetical protein
MAFDGSETIELCMAEWYNTQGLTKNKKGDEL